VIAVALAICGAVGSGFWAEHRWGARAQVAARRVLDVMLYVLVPFSAFFLVARLDITTGVVGGLGLAYIVLATVGVLAWAMGRFGLRLATPAIGALVVAVILANTGYLGLPLTIALLGGDDLGAAVAWDSLVSQPMFFAASFAVGAAFGTTAGEGAAARTRAFFARNPPLWAVAAGLLAPEVLAPDVLYEAAKVVVFAMLPLGFFAVGVSLAHEAEEGAVRFPPAFTAPVATVVGLRLFVAPAILLGLSALTFDVPDAYRLMAAMPSGLNGLVVAHAFGLDLRIAAGAIFWSTAVVVVVGIGSVVV
jgi:malate permease and related proteins